MRVIVLGGSGQIGSVVRENLSRHHNVISTSRKVADQHIQFDPFRDDWAVLGEADVLVNCIGAIHASGVQGFSRIHVELTRCIINNRAVIGNPRIVQISALGASPQHLSDFLRTKGIADDLLLQEPDTTVIRPYASYDAGEEGDDVVADCNVHHGSHCCSGWIHEDTCSARNT